MTEWRRRAFAVVRVILGLLLLAAASLKMYGWSVSAIPPLGWFSTPEVQAAAIGWEVFLGAWLLSGFFPIGSWLAAGVTFVLLAGISGYLGWIGQATCGCFGTIKASPWHAVALDVASLILLLLAVPSRQRVEGGQRWESWRTTTALMRFVLGVGVMLGALMGMGAWVYGSPRAAWARLRGESLTATPEYVDCGSGKPGERLETEVNVSNWTDDPVLIYGGTSDCSCATTSGLPIALAPRETRSIPLRLRVPQSEPGVFTRRIELLTDCEQQRTIRLRVGCRVK